MLLFFENFRLLFGPSTQKSRPFSSTDGFLRNVIALFYFLPVLQAPESLDITAFLIRTNHMRIWLQKYLEDKYKGAHIVTVDSHARTLDVILEDYGMIDHYPQTVGLDIQIDVLGIIVKGGKSAIAFIEAKKTQLNLHDLGQLWAYCKLCDPAEAFLLSSAGIGSLNKILNNLSRTDLLDFGDGRKIKKMQVAKWDITSNSIDFRTLVPRI